MLSPPATPRSPPRARWRWSSPWRSCPTVIAYRINPLTHAYVIRVVKVDYANLINVMLDREAVPELLQYDCTPEKLAAAVMQLLDDKAAASEQIAA